VRGNPKLTTLEGLTTSLRSVGAFRGADVFIEDNPQLASLAGLEAPRIAVYGSVTVAGNGPQLPAASVQALEAKAVPVPITIETLANGLPANVSRPAAAAAAAAPAAAPSAGPAATVSPDAAAAAPPIAPALPAAQPAAAAVGGGAAAAGPNAPAGGALPGVSPVSG
jgi:hypothetical protein